MWLRSIGLLFLALVGIYLPNSMFHDLSIIAMVNMVLFFFAGTIMGLTPSTVAAPSGQRLAAWLPGTRPAIGAQ